MADGSLIRTRELPFDKALLGLAVTVVAVFLIAPLLVVLVISFTQDTFFEFPPQGFSLRWYREVLGVGAWRDSLWVSLRAGVVAAVLSLVLASIASVVLLRVKMSAKSAVYALLLTPMLMSPIVISVAVYFFFADLQAVGRIVGIGVAQSILSIPLAFILINSAMQSFDQQLEDAAVSLGASRLRAFLTVTVPVIAPAILSAGMFGFLRAFEDLEVALLMGGVSTKTLNVQIWDQVQFQLQPSIAAASGLLIAMEILVVALGALVQRGRAVRFRNL